MPARCQQSVLSVALVGTPNTGKSTLFSDLVGVRQHVGNYPGVTVEKTVGRMRHSGGLYEVVDLPGLYSLAPRSRDEMVAVDLLLGRSDGRPPAAVISIVDAANLERHLYLFSQVLELGLPTVVALNMVDVAEEHGIAVDAARLADRLGVPVVPMQANRGVGVAELKAALGEVIGRPARSGFSPLPQAFEDEVTRLEADLAEAAPAAGGDRALKRYLVRRLLLDASGYLERTLLSHWNGRARDALTQSRHRLAEAGCVVPGVETEWRHRWTREVLDGVVTRPAEYKVTVSDRIDRVLTHRLWGTLVFLAVMLVVFQSVFVWAEPLMSAIEWAVESAAGRVESWMAAGALRSLIVDGVLGGVGGVLAFLPQIAILFLFIALLEDCGYMARAAFLMDRMMARIGLSGKSFIPMLSSFACAIPGVMAARVIENERDRLTTILVAPLMTCSARLPVYALLIAAFVPAHAYLGGLLNLQGLTLAGLYGLGIATAVLTALVLKRSLLRGETPPFLMELPSYKRPSARTIGHRVLVRVMSFVRCAGTLILTVSVLVWAALYYPHDTQRVEGPRRPEIERLESQLAAMEAGEPGRAAVVGELAEIRGQIGGEYQRQSFLGRAGRLIEPVFRPLGWDWRIGSAVLASFPAREVVVATLGVIFNLGDELDAESGEGFTQMNSRLHTARWEGTDRPLFTLPVALSIMVFYALCAQCAATLAVIRRETNSWRWPLFSFTYMSVLAYVGALVTYQLGTWLAGI
jgi:ferrous iron transport protein B